MKKLIITLISCAILATSFAGCGYDPLADTQPTTVATEETGTEQETEKTYKDNYSGLEQYMADKGYIDKYDEKKKNRIEMNAELIGAKKGYRYTKNTVNVELYQFDTEKLNDTGKEIIDSVKKDGYYTIYDKKIKAYISDNGKFMMIYVDSAVTDNTESDAYKTQENAIKDFQAFGK